jgi:hypothetical protein
MQALNPFLKLSSFRLGPADESNKAGASIASSVDRAADEALVAAANNGDESAFAFGEAPSYMV